MAEITIIFSPSKICSDFVDKSANSFEGVFSNKSRTLPEIPNPCVPKTKKSNYNNDPLNDLQKSILKGASHIAQRNQKFSSFLVKTDAVENIDNVGDAIDYLKSVKGLLYK